MTKSFSTKNAAILFVLAVSGVIFWSVLAFPRLTVLQISIERNEALRIASDYLRQTNGLDVKAYHHAVIFSEEQDVSRYLQKAFGRKEAKEWQKKNDFELFYWSVRFFKPGEKEEYRLDISGRDGKVLEYRKTIDDNEPRPEVSPLEARSLAEKAVVREFGLDLAGYELKDSSTTRRSKRADQDFSWKRKDVDIPWSKVPGAEGAKLLAAATVAGNEVIAYSRHYFLIPDGFDRHIDQEQESGRNLSAIFYFVFMAVMVAAVLVILKGRQHLALVTARSFYFKISIALFAAIFLGSLTLFQSVVMNYPTSQVFGMFLWRAVMQILLSAAFITLGFLVTGLAAEALRFKEDTSSGKGALLYYIRSTFMARDMLFRVLAGYAIACALLGLQALLYDVGEKYFGVWSGEAWLTQFSNSYIPALVAFAMGFKASLTEELAFRVFLFYQLRSWTRNLVVAAVLSSLVWGFGHTGYAVFPSWFRGVEVAILGLLFTAAYLRFGIVTVLVAHYLFDVFWASSGCLFGQVKPFYFLSSILVLLLPLAWGLWACFRNRSEQQRPWSFVLSPWQIFNRRVLEGYLSRQMAEEADLSRLEKEFLDNGWDPVVVREVFAREGTATDH